MKPKLFDRILLGLLLLITTVLSLGLLVLALRFIPLENVQQLIAAWYPQPIWQLVLISSGFVILLLSLRLMFAGGKKRQDPLPSSTLVQTTDLGAAYISIAAIDAMVQKHCRANNRIRSVNSTVLPVREGGVVLRIRLSLMPDTNIPELSGALQKSLKEYVERLSGISVREVSILVEDTSLNPQSRVD